MSSLMLARFCSFFKSVHMKEYGNMTITSSHFKSNFTTNVTVIYFNFEVCHLLPWMNKTQKDYWHTQTLILTSSRIKEIEESDHYTSLSAVESTPVRFNR